MTRVYTSRSQLATNKRHRAQRRNFALLRVKGACANLRLVAQQCDCPVKNINNIETWLINQVKLTYEYVPNSFS